MSSAVRSSFPFLKLVSMNRLYAQQDTRPVRSSVILPCECCDLSTLAFKEKFFPFR